MNHRNHRRATAGLLALLVAGSLAGCASSGAQTGERRTNEPYFTRRDKLAKGAAIGAAVGAVGAYAAGKREADEILVGAGIGAIAGGGIGAYMDAQEEKLARIPGTTVERVSEDTLLVHFDSDILFATDSSALSGSSRATLGDVAAVLQEYPKTAVVVQGHTDSTGSEEHNQELSERRANAVRGYLASQGVDPARLAAMGFGETMPVADNDSAAGRQQNRRVDVMLHARAR